MIHFLFEVHKLLFGINGMLLLELHAIG